MKDVSSSAGRVVTCPAWWNLSECCEKDVVTLLQALYFGTSSRGRYPSVMHQPPEDIVQYKRERKLYKEHVKRVHHANPMIDTLPPESLGLKHLEDRAKKKQLIEDRQQTVAKQNKHLMERMTKIMAEERRQGKHKKRPGKDERVRREAAEKINRDNKLLAARLQRTVPVMSQKKFEDDFRLHTKIGGYLKKKRYGPARLKPITSGASPTKTAPSFDADSYMSIFGGGRDSLFDSTMMEAPINSMSEFRKQVISSKRMNSDFAQSRSAEPSQRGHAESMGATQQYGSPKKEIRFELTHEPSY